MTDPFRLDVAGKAEDGGKVFIEVPTLNGKRIALPARTDANGNFRVILTVRPEAVSSDLGLDRQNKPSEVEAGTNVSVRTEGGKCTLVTMRVKPLQKKAVVAAAPHDPIAKAAGGAADKKDIIEVGSLWAGPDKVVGGADATMKCTITASDGDTFTLTTVRSDGGIFDWYCARRNGKPVVEKIVRVRGGGENGDRNPQNGQEVPQPSTIVLRDNAIILQWQRGQARGTITLTRVKE